MKHAAVTAHQPGRSTQPSPRRRAARQRTAAEHALALLVLPLALLIGADETGPVATVGRVALVLIAVCVAAARAAALHQTQRPWRLTDWAPEIVLLAAVALLLLAGGATWLILLVVPLHLLRVSWVIPRLQTVAGRWHAALLACGTLVVGGLTFSVVEARPAGDGIWWALCTMTTVGYGDVAPVTAAGRVLAAATMLIGIGLLTSVVTSVARSLAATDREVMVAEQHIADELRRVEARLERLEARIAVTGRTHHG